MHFCDVWFSNATLYALGPIHYSQDPPEIPRKRLKSPALCVMQVVMY